MRQLLKDGALKGEVLILKWEKKVRWDFKNLSSSLFKSATFMMFSFTYCRTTSYFHYSIFFIFWCSYGYNMVIFLISTSLWNAAFTERSHLFWYECEKVRRLLEGEYAVFSSPNAGKYRPEKLRIGTLFTQWRLSEARCLLKEIRYMNCLFNLSAEPWKIIPEAMIITWNHRSF